MAVTGERLRPARLEPALRAVVCPADGSTGRPPRGAPTSVNDNLDRLADPHLLEGFQARSGGLLFWQIARVERLIDDAMGDKLTIAQLGAETRLSTSHFGRAFRIAFGLSPHAHLMRRRLWRARVLMLSTDEPLSTIATACGLSDQAHLTRLFRRHYDQTPSAYRRTNRPR
jgi:AraC family transcriptional regulator